MSDYALNLILIVRIIAKEPSLHSFLFRHIIIEIHRAI